MPTEGRMVMPQQPQELAASEWGTISYYPQWNTLELKWDPRTRDMTEDGFKSTLQMLADQGLKVRPAYMIVDSTDFFHTVADGILAWRDQYIVPLYNEAGVQKFAFLVTDAMPGTVEKGVQPGPDGPALFPTGWFETRERLYAWLTG